MKVSRYYCDLDGVVILAESNAANLFFCVFFQCEARMSAVPLHCGPHVGSGPRSASQCHAQRAADDLSSGFRCQRAAHAEQTLPTVHFCLCGCLQLAGGR